MNRTLQPCDWYEHDTANKYVVDVFGRTDQGKVACLRINGFKPYFYVRGSKPDISSVTCTKTTKYDAFAGFADLKKVEVWKVVCDTKAKFMEAAKKSKGIVYESGLPPFMRLFHERHLGPASALVFKEHRFTIPVDRDTDEPIYNVDAFYHCDVSEISASNAVIPMKVASYDLEMYSKSGMFPQAKKGDPIIQIGISYRWSDKMLDPIRRVVYVLGDVDTSEDDTEFIECDNEEDMLFKFMYEIRKENPDIMCGYNTFGFDDSYIEDRCQQLGILDSIDLSRYQSKMKDGDIWKVKFSETKKFELASGKYDLRYLTLRGRLGIDLLLNMRREHSLDSFKLDNVASTFLRDKVLKYGGGKISTKSTRGLVTGNYVKFDIVGNTSDPYQDGRKFKVNSVDAKGFAIAGGEDLFADLSEKDRSCLEWTFTKDDVDPHELFRLHREGGPAGRARIAKYCIQDCDLVLTLMAKLDTIVNARGMADVCKVPMEYVLRRGQGIKIFSAVVYYAAQRDQILRTQQAAAFGDGYEGAIVLPPKIGMYLDQPISVLDFNSLYPTNMISYNLSPDTLLCEREFNVDGQKIRHEGLSVEVVNEMKERYTLEEIDYDTKDDKGVIVGKTVCTFVQKDEARPMTEGVLPKTLDILLKKRKEFKEKMEDQQYDEAQRSVFNGLQLAYKVVANSVYGQTGSRTSPIRKLCVAACTTAAGRKMLNFAKKIVETEYGAEVIYGDSVASYTPITIRIGNTIEICSVEELGRRGTWKYAVDGEKEYCELQGVETWTEKGWTLLHRILRHALAPEKKMVRVLTHSGLVDVTDDHSLLRPDGTEVSSKSLVVGDCLLHHVYPPPEDSSTGHSVEEARVVGFFCGDGSCGYYECPSGDKASWALNNANIDLLEVYRPLCRSVYPEFEWNILPTIVSSNVFKLVPNGRGVKKFVLEYRKQCYTDNRKNIPQWVMNGSIEIRQAFWDGFYDADGDKDLNGYIRFDQKHQTTCAQLAWLGSSLGYNVSLNDRSDKPMICRMTFTKSPQRKNPAAIKKMYEMVEYSGYVYDLTTDNHHFQAGVGTMIVHNTDSIFIRFPTKDLVDSIKMGIEAGKQISLLSRKPYKIAYEKTFYPFILFCRKRYVGMKYEEDPTKCKRMSMGIVLKRRDNAPIVKDVFGGALDVLMVEKDVHKAQAFVNQKLLDVIENRIPLEKFIISKSLRDDYKNPTQIAHRVLADRMASRDPGTAPKVGDRLQFVFVDENKDKGKQGDRIEEVGYVKSNGLKPDTVFYITNQIQNPVAQLFALCIEKLDGYVAPRNPSYTTILEKMLEKHDGDEEAAVLAVLGKKENQLDELMFMRSRTLGNILRRNMRGPMDAFVRRG